MEEILLGIDLPTDLIRHIIIPQLFSLSKMVENRLYNTILGLNLISNIEKYPLNEIIDTLMECCKHNYPPVFRKIYEVWTTIYKKKHNTIRKKIIHNDQENYSYINRINGQEKYSYINQIKNVLLCCATYLKPHDNQMLDIYKCFLDDYITYIHDNSATYDYSFGQILMQLTINDDLDILLYTVKLCTTHGIIPSSEMRHYIPKMILELNPDQKHSDVANILEYSWDILNQTTSTHTFQIIDNPYCKVRLNIDAAAV